MKPVDWAWFDIISEGYRNLRDTLEDEHPALFDAHIANRSDLRNYAKAMLVDSEALLTAIVMDTTSPSAGLSAQAAVLDAVITTYRAWVKANAK